MYRFLATTMAVMTFCAGTAVAEDYAAAGESVISGAFSAMGAGDIQAAVKFFAPDAVYVAIPAPWDGKAALVGPDEIGAWLGFLADDNSTIVIHDVKVDGNRITFGGDFAGDHFRKQGIDVIPMDGVAILKDGLIQGLMWY